MEIHKHHLSYCLNIHPGESWDEHFEAVKNYALKVKEAISPDAPFGLGLRISNKASFELLEENRLAEFKSYLDEHGMYAFTINGFPFGAFHQTVVKEKVYQPDWRSDERRDYTLRLAKILAGLLPEGVDGSISTVPVSFKGWINTPEEIDETTDRLAELAFFLHQLKEDTGKTVHLGLEPEPCCYLETTDEFIHYYRDELMSGGAQKMCALMNCDLPFAKSILRRYIGICFDCCHMAIQYEDLSESLKKLAAEKILISKIHLSAALRLEDVSKISLLEPYAESTYLHQVKASTSNELLSWVDLPEALEALPQQEGIEEMRIHFHVPLFWGSSGELQSTRSAMDETFWALVKKLGVNHLEAETYTFDVMPEDIKKSSVVDSLVAELDWCINRLS